MTKELEPLKPDQIQVTRMPRFTTELPFFYLTKKKELLSKQIQYDGLDEDGRPVKWSVTPNTLIGAPSIEAHQVWTRLVRPAINSKKTPDGKLAAIVPLGNLRQCLRAVGWKEGGWEAQDFLRALRQIGSAWCVADFWLPTTETDESGTTLFKRIRAEFSRMSLYAVGSKHVTDEDVKEGRVNFDFDLDDTVYVQLHAVEVELQRLQPELPVDNEYLFSVNPSARRWYELLAPKFFGVVKNKGEYCEIRYSWYVQHHPTLKRYYERKRVVFQMDRLIKDHLEFGYVSRVQYRAIKEPDREVDYIIRYYPGEGAKESIARILGHIRGQKKQSKSESLIGERSNTLPNAIPTTSSNPKVDALAKRGVAEPIAKRLVSALQNDQRFDDQLEYVDHLVSRQAGKIGNPAGYYVAFIRDNGEVPMSFETTAKKRLREEARASQERDVNDRATLELAYQQYLDDELENYIAENLSEAQYQDLIAAKKQEMLKVNKLAAAWPEDAFTRLAEPVVRGELKKRLTDLWTFEAFCKEKNRGVTLSAAATTRFETDELPDLFPAPEPLLFDQLVSGPSRVSTEPIGRALANFCPRCEGKRHVLQEGSTTLYELCSCVTG